MANQGRTHEQHAKAGQKSHESPTTHAGRGKQGGTHEQHVKAGEQSHKNTSGSSDSKANKRGSSKRSEKMGMFSKPIETLDDLFVHMLQDIYYAENQIVKNLPTMVEEASSPDLKTAFQNHLEETEGHVQRLEQVFKMHGQPVKGVTCQAMDGILAEAKEVIDDCDDAEVCDAAMLAAAQAVEHYEMTRYGTLIAFAKQLGRDDCAAILSQTLAEERAADKKLTGIAEKRVNREAVHAD